jgi:hypothetical protein
LCRKSTPPSRTASPPPPTQRIAPLTASRSGRTIRVRQPIQAGARNAICNVSQPVPCARMVWMNRTNKKVWEVRKWPRIS